MTNNFVGKKIVQIYYRELPPVQRFENREILIRLDNELIFDLSNLLDAWHSKVRPFIVRPVAKTSDMVLVADQNSEPNLRSKISSIVHSSKLDTPAFLLENKFVVFVGVAEFSVNFVLHELPEEIGPTLEQIDLQYEQ